MGFKSDREFLRNISIGAVGTRKVASLLDAGGFRVIELERYCTCNKIWATKIKRLRVPDLLCLKTGTRIECRAKSALKLTMSHAVNNADRAWDKGLRDSDLVAFIYCTPDGDTWSAAGRVNLFAVGEMRRTAHRAGLGRMKAASEGSEIQLTWTATVPANAGTVAAVSPDRIETVLSGGRRQSYRLRRKEFDLSPHVVVGDTFGAGDTIIASELPSERSANLLDELARDNANPSELRAAAVWALAAMPRPHAAGPLTYVNDDDELTAVHAIVASSRLISDENIEAVLAEIDDDQRRSAGIVRAVLRSSCNPVPVAVRLLKAATGNRRSWLLYLLASAGRAKSADYLRQSAPELLSQLEFFWTHQTENWTNRLDVADQIDFLAQQNIR